MDAAVRASAAFFGVGGSKLAIVTAFAPLSTAAHGSSAAVREAPVMTVAWSAARAWRGDGVSALAASARAASLQVPCDGWSRGELRALWEFLRFSILRRERCGGLEALGCCCKDVFRLLRRTPTRSDVLLCFVLCLLGLDPSQATLAVRGTGPEHLP